MQYRRSLSFFPLSQAGLTLIELMVVVALLGILAAAALPSYQQHLMRSRRAEAQAVLAAITQAQESYRGTHSLYADSLATLGFTPPASSNYDFALSSNSEPPFEAGYQVMALAKAGSPQTRDAQCRLLSIRLQSGQMSYADAACWPK